MHAGYGKQVRGAGNIVTLPFGIAQIASIADQERAGKRGIAWEEPVNARAEGCTDAFGYVPEGGFGFTELHVFNFDGCIAAQSVDPQKI